MLVRGGEKGDKVPVRAAETPVPYLAEHHLGDAVQRGKVHPHPHPSRASHSA